MRKRSLVSCLILAVVMVMVQSTSIMASPWAGVLDPTFSSGSAMQIIPGVDTWPLTCDNNNSQGIATVQQPDGKILVVGVDYGPPNVPNNTPNPSIVLLRLNADGTSDYSFGGGTGYVNWSSGTGMGDGPVAIALQSDGKILVVGNDDYSDIMYGACIASSNFPPACPTAQIILRFNTDGSLDNSFGTNGVIFSATGTTGSDIAVQPNGQILVLGGTYITNGLYPGGIWASSLQRYNLNGTLDANFGLEGTTTIIPTLPTGQPSTPGNLALESNGQIVVSGTILNMPSSGNPGAFVSRLSSNGVVDASFGAGGYVTYWQANSGNIRGTQPSAVAVQADGKVLLSTYDMANGDPPRPTNQLIIRYDTYGNFDTSFGTGGTTSLGTVAVKTIQQPDGKILIGDSDPGIIRLNTDGTFDSSFGLGGFYAFSVPEPSPWWEDFTTVNGMALQADGQVLLTGTTYGINGCNPLTGYWDPNNSLFLMRVSGGVSTNAGVEIGHSAYNNTDSSQSYAGGAASQADNKIVAVGSSDSISQANWISLAMRFNTDGSPDTGFGPNGDGSLTYPDSYLDSVAIQNDGKIVAAGATNEGQLLLLRFNTDGSQDNSFGSSGAVKWTLNPSTTDEPMNIVIQPDGKIIAGGTDYSQTQTLMELVRFNTDGSLDTSFGSGGVVLWSSGANATANSGLALQSNGQILIAVQDDNLGYVMQRYNPNGTLDTSYGTSGTLVPVITDSTIYNLSQVAIDPNGNALALLGLQVGQGVARFKSDSTFDTTFGIGGLATIPVQAGTATSLSVQPDAKILLSGGYSVTELFAMRLNTDGSLDSTYGDYAVYSSVKFTEFTNGIGLSTYNGDAMALRPDGVLAVVGERINSHTTPPIDGMEVVLFSGDPHNINVQLTGTGTGVVTSSETPTPTIDCGTQCAAMYTNGSTVTLTAVAAAGSIFNGWSGSGCTGTGVCSLTASSTSQTVTAEFQLNTFTITATSGGNGTVSCTPNPVNSGSSSVCTITPATGYSIATVTVDGAAQTPAPSTYTFRNVTANHTIAATFAIQTFTITPIPGSNGSLTCTPNPVNYGSSSTCMIAPATGYIIATVTVDGVAQTPAPATYTFSNVTANHTIAATFAPNTYSITTTSGGNGTVSCTPNPVNHGLSSVCAITPITGYVIATVTVDGVAQAPAPATYTFSNVTANHTIAATFAVQTFTISAAAGSNGLVSCTPTSVAYGGSSTCTITPGTNYVVGTVTLDGVPQTPPLLTYALSNITANQTIAVTFVLQPFVITATADGNGGTVTCSPDPVSYGSNSVCAVTPSAGNHVRTLAVDGTGITPVTSYTFSSVKAHHTIEASFAINQYSIAATSGPNGTVVCTPDPVNWNSNSVCAITPASGYAITGVQVDGVTQTPPPSSYTFSNVTAYHAISATFAAYTAPNITSLSCNTSLYTYQPGSCTASATAAHGTVQYAWSISSGTITQGTNPSTAVPVVTTAGTVTVTLKASVKEDPALTTTKTATITVTADTITQTLSCSPTSVAMGQSTTCTATATDKYGTPVFSWSSVGGTISGSGKSVTIKWMSQTSGSNVTVTASIQQAPGITATNTQAITVTALDPPHITITTPSAIYVTEPVTISATATSKSDPVNLVWTINGQTYTGTSVTVSFPTVGSNTISVTGTLPDFIGQTGSTTTVTKTVSVLAIPAPTATVTVPSFGEVGIPMPVSVKLTAPYLTPTGQWTFPDGSTSTALSTTYTPRTADLSSMKIIYTAWLVEQPSKITTVTKTLPVYTYTWPTFSLTAKPGTSGLTPYTVTLTAQPSITQPHVFKYTWTFGDGTATVIQNVSVGTESHKYSQAGTYTVTAAIDDLDGHTTSVTTTITVTDPPPLAVSGFTITPAAPSGGYTHPVTLSLTPTVTGGNPAVDTVNSWAWTVNGVATGSSVKTLSYTFSSSGTYTVGVTVKTNTGRSATGSTTVTVN